MTKWQALWKTVRPVNLFIMAFSMIGVYGGIVSRLDGIETNYISTCLLTLSIILLGAGGNVINDIEDVQIDAINKPGVNQVGITLSSRWAFSCYYALTISGVFLGVIVSVIQSDLYLFLIIIFIAVSLWLYSRWLQKRILVGNFIVAILCGLLPILPAILYNDFLADNHDFIIAEKGTRWFMHEIESAWKLSIIYALFGFTLTLLREQIKDIEDLEGDLLGNYRTLPSRYGLRFSKRSLLLQIIIFTSLAVAPFLKLFWPDSLSSPTFLYLIVILLTMFIVPATLLAHRINLIRLPSQASSISKGLKITMALGIATTAFFWFL